MGVRTSRDTSTTSLPWVGLLCVLVVGAAAVAVAWSMTDGRLLVIAAPAVLTAIAGIVVVHGSRASAGLAELLAAVVGISVGTTRGIRFVAADEADPVAWVAVAALVAGAVLLVLGTWHLLAGTRGWWRLPVGLAVLLGVPVTIYLLVIPLAVTNSPRGPSPSATDHVSFATADGVQLSGTFTPTRNGAGIVVVPGAGSHRDAAAEQARVLAGAGYGVLVYDPRGHGLSGGRPMEFGWAGDEDVSAAVGFLADQPGVDPDRIGALGLSMGGEEVLGAASADPRIKAVVAEGATNRVAADYDWLPAQYGWRGRVQQVLDVPRFALIDLFTSQTPPVPLRDAVAGIAPRPVLLIAAGSVPDEGHAAAHIASGSPATVAVWVVPGSGHTAGLSTQPQQWRRAVLSFFGENL